METSVVLAVIAVFLCSFGLTLSVNCLIRNRRDAKRSRALEEEIKKRLEGLTWQR